MTARTKKIQIAIAGGGLLLLLPLVSFIAYVLYTFDSALIAGQYPHRADAEMIRCFHTHRSAFEEVRAMAMADTILRRVDEDWSDPVNLSDQLWKEIRK